MKCKRTILAIGFLSVLAPVQGASLDLGVGVSYLYPAGRLGEGLNGGAKGEVVLSFPIHPRVHLGGSLGYATLGGKENERLRAVLSPLELVLQVKVMELTKESSILLDTGLGAVGISRTLNSGREGSVLGGEVITSLGLGVGIPFGTTHVNLRLTYHRILDTLKRGDLFSLGGLISYGIGS